MNKRINFEDNIFILTTRIRMIRDLLRLDTDAELFLEKTLDDLEFVDGTLTVLMEHLISNTKMIERDEEFHNLKDTDALFSQTIHEIINGSGSISVAQFPLIEERMHALMAKSDRRRREITDSISASEQEEVDPLVVSSAELSELLKGLED